MALTQEQLQTIMQQNAVTMQEMMKNVMDHVTENTKKMREGIKEKSEKDKGDKDKDEERRTGKSRTRTTRTRRKLRGRTSGRTGTGRCLSC